MQKDTEHRTPETPGYEVRDIDVGGILRPALALTVVTLLTFLAMTWMLDFLEWRADWLWKRDGVVAREPEAPPAPRLQSSPPAELAETRTAETQVLTSYGWIDRKKGIVRVPIEKAMALVVEEGLPAREGGSR